MGRQRANGVDAAIALLKALVAHDGVASGHSLAAEIGLPRSSFHRIVHTLVASGLLTSQRGLIRVGPLAQSLIVTSVERMRTERGAHAPRQQWAAVRVAALDPAEGRGPIALAKPMRTNLRTGRLRIGFSNISLDNPWRVALVHSIEHAASGLGEGIARLTVRHAENNAQAQAEHIRELVESGVDGLIVSAAPSPLVGEAIEAAMSRGIEVVMVDRRLPDARPTCFVSTSDISIGQTTALWLAETLAGVGAILLLPGREEAEPAQIRLAAARGVFARFPQIEFLGVEWTGWQREAGYEAAARAIAQFGHRIAGVWCDSGLQGVGSLQAFINAGWKTGHIPPHTGGDLNLVYKLAIKHEVKLAAVDYPPSMGIRAVEVLFAALRGHYVPRRIEVASDVILTRGAATVSVKPHLWAEDHVRWDLPNDLVLASGLGPAYNPRAFRIRYPGNSYNRSAARPLQRTRLLQRSGS